MMTSRPSGRQPLVGSGTTGHRHSLKQEADLERERRDELMINYIKLDKIQGNILPYFVIYF